MAVTGLGFVTPIGNDLETVWSSLVEGVSGVGRISHFDTTDYSTKIAAEVRGFDPEQYMDRKTARHAGRSSRATCPRAASDRGVGGHYSRNSRCAMLSGSSVYS